MSRFSRTIVHGNTSRALTKNILAMFSTTDDPRDVNFDDEIEHAKGNAPFALKKGADGVFRGALPIFIDRTDTHHLSEEDAMIEALDRKRLADIDEEECEVNHDFVFPDEDVVVDPRPEAALYRAVAASLADPTAQKAFIAGAQPRTSCDEHRAAEEIRIRVSEFSPRFPRTFRPLSRAIVQEIRVSY